MNQVYYIKILFLIFIPQKEVLSQVLNKIIPLGVNNSSNFRYSHFSFSSNGDMIVDSSSYPETKERRFFGLKKNGQFYFTDSNNHSTPYHSLKSIFGGRLEGESLFFKLSENNCQELLMGISKYLSQYLEIYDLKNNSIYEFKFDQVFGYIESGIFSSTKRQNDFE